MRYLILCVVFLSGCASAGMNGGCMHVVGNGSYATANGALDGCLCHQGCLGLNCPKPDYTSLSDMQIACVNAAKGVITTVPITVGVVPTAK